MRAKYRVLAVLFVLLPAGIILMAANMPHTPHDMILTVICVVPLGLAGLIGCFAAGKSGEAIQPEDEMWRSYPLPGASPEGRPRPKPLTHIATTAAGPSLALVGIVLCIRLRYADVPTTAWFWLAAAAGIGLVFLATTLHVLLLRSKGRAWLAYVCDRGTLPIIVVLALLLAVPLLVILLAGWWRS